MSKKNIKGLKMKPNELLHPEQRLSSKAYLVNKLRKAVFTWREQGYPHTTDTTRRLLQFWFEEEIFKDTENSIERKTKAYPYFTSYNLR